MNEAELRRYCNQLENKIDRVQGMCDDTMKNGSMYEKRLARTILELIKDD